MFSIQSLGIDRLDRIAQVDDHWLGYLQDYPDYWTQGESLEDLLEHLRDLHKDLESGTI